jgi:hypothetical protein
MRKLLIVALLAGALALVTFVPRATTAPALSDKPVRYEYAELTYGRVAQPQFGGGGRGGGQFGGQPGGGGNAAGRVTTTIRWTTGEEEVEVQEWSELGDKLKAPAPKKESPQSVHRLRVLNKLSADGWEMLDRPLGESRAFSATGWSFRRRVP